jgi:hypothetical protein
MPVTFQRVIESPWTEISPIRVGKIPPGIGTPLVFVLAEDMDGTRIRIDVYSSGSAEAYCFQEAILWHHWVAVGFGAWLHLVPIEQGPPISINLEEYFGHLYPTDALLLVASAEQLHCFNPDGTRKWSSPILGIDGVVVHDIAQDVIYGEGEWDPPGGWEPFQIRVSSGELVKP